MIQRIQSLLLFGASICLIAMFYFDIATFTNAQNTVFFNLCYVHSSDVLEVGIPNFQYSTYAPYVVLVLSVLLLVTIFMYKNRKRQMLLTNICFLLNLVFLALTLMTPDKLQGLLAKGEWVQHIGPGYFLPIASIVCIILANKAIKKDDTLVKAADRLR